MSEENKGLSINPFDDAIDKMFENRNLNRNPERVIKFNNDVLDEITDDRYKRLMTEIISKVKADNKLIDRIFAFSNNPLLNIILPPLVPKGVVDIHSKGLADDVVHDIMKIFANSNVHLEDI